MRMNGKLIVLIFAIVLMIGSTFLKADVTAQSTLPNLTVGPGPASQITGPQPFKNLQALPDLKDSPPELFSAMDFMSGSLSVSCAYCHVLSDLHVPPGGIVGSPVYNYYIDEKKTKLIARDMIKMTRAINEANFGGRPVVTCNTCHQGTTHPNGVPTPWYKTPEQIAAYNKFVGAAGQSEAGPAVPATTLPDADTVIANYRKAVGADGLKTLTLTGTNNLPLVGSGDIAFEISAIFPDKVRVRQSIGTNSGEILLNGQNAWSISPQGTMQPIPPANSSRPSVDLFLPVKNIKSNSSQKVTGIEKIGAGTYYVVLAQAGKRSRRLYFDVQSGLLYKDRNEIETVLGTGVNEIVFEDYHDVSGVKIPYKVTTHFMGNEYFAHISDAKTNIPLEPAKFEPPQAAPEHKP